MFCPNCGIQIPDDSKFCPECGTPLSYVVLAAIYGWRYIVMFGMDDVGVTHIQMPKLAK